jgi:hypothetical protein
LITHKLHVYKYHKIFWYLGGNAGASPCFEVDLMRVVEELLNLELFTELGHFR